MARSNQPAEVYPLSRLNRWFALAGVALVAATFWLIWADWSRPWKEIQRDFHAVERARLSGEREAATAMLEKDEAAAELAKLRDQHDEALAALYDRRAVIDGQESLVVQMRTERDIARQAFERSRAELTVLEYRAEKRSLDPEDPEGAASALAAFRETERETARLERSFKEKASLLSRAEQSLEASIADEREARRRVDAAVAAVTAIETRLAALETGPLTALLRDAPLVDFMAPSVRVHQIVIPDLRDDFGFASVQKEDRCTTCHRGIDRPQYARHPETGRFLDGMTRAAVERDLWEATRAAIAARLGGQEAVDAADDLTAFERKPELFFEDWLDDAIASAAQRAAILDATREQRDRITRRGATLGAHPHLDRFVRSGSSHPLATTGCTICHEGHGHSTDFVRVAHTPSDPQTEQRWRRLYDWARSAYWEQPQLPLEHVTASCASCHDAEVRIEGAGGLNRGRRAVEQLGCFGCHQLDGLSGELQPIGPSLSKLASKYGLARVYQWIWEPRSLRTESRMPRFFGQPNNSNERFFRATQQEARGMAAYLLAKSGPFEVAPLWAGGDAERGKTLFETVGCLACHSVRSKGQVVADHGPDLSGLGSLLEAAWIYAWTLDPKRYFDSSRMPSLRLTQSEALDITRYLETLREAPNGAIPVPPRDEKLQGRLLEQALRATLPPKELTTRLANMDPTEREQLLGEVSISKYGCYACHDVGGFEKAERIGPELSTWGSKPKAWLDFALVPEAEIPRTRIEWATHKLRQPRVYDSGKSETKTFAELLRMPNFGLTDERVKDVVTFLLSRKRRILGEKRRRVLNDAGAAVQAGRKLARQLNCYGCHHLDGEGGLFARYWQYDREQNRARFVGREPLADFSYLEDVPDPVRPFVPPPLLEEGRRVRPEWLFRYLREPTRVRPALPTRMPTFDLTDEDANVLVRMLTGIEGSLVAYHSSYEPSPKLARIGAQMFRRGQCTRCHLYHAGDRPAARGLIGPDLARVGERLQADWIPRWLADPPAILPGTKMPRFFEREQGTTILDPDGTLLHGDLERGTRALRDYLLTQPDN